MQTTRIFYLFDPLCGWCYGAAPLLEKLSTDGIHVEAIPTGLFSGAGARPLDSSFAAYAWANDKRIATLTGQAFSTAYRENLLQKPGVMFDSQASTTAVVATGMEDVKLRFTALRILQTARYVDGLDTADITVVTSLLDKAGLSRVASRLREPDEELNASVRNIVAFGQTLFQQMNANGVPALVIEQDGRRRLLDSSTLFKNSNNLLALVEAA